SPVVSPSRLSFNRSRASYSMLQISSQIYSPVSRWVIFQSASAVYFPRRSETPDAVRRSGAFLKISVSATTTTGDTAVKLFLQPCHVIAATVETNPSTLAAVGTEKKGIFISYA